MLVPNDRSISIGQLTTDPYPIYQRLRADSPVLKVASVGRILLTKAQDTQYVKDHPELFSSDDPNTPMEKAFQAKTLMRRDGEDHNRLRRAMMPALSIPVVKNIWQERVEKIADEYVAALPKGETVDFFSAFAGPFSARCLAEVLGIPEASDTDIQRWSQALIDGAGNFAGLAEPFERTAVANREINQCIEHAIATNAAASVTVVDRNSALAVQTGADDPIEMEHIISNIKIAIGGGINEPRDAILTALFGLLTNPDQLHSVKDNPDLFSRAFEEAVRWVAPIQVSSRRVTRDTELGGYELSEGEVVMTVQASANRDEDVHTDGQLFNIFRVNKKHQAFGNGPHFCMGIHLSRRMVGEIALPRLFQRFPNMKLIDPEAVVWSGFGFRGPLNLPILLQ